MTWAHDMELSIVANGSMDPPTQNPKRSKEKLNNHKGDKAFLKTSSKKTTTTNIAQTRFLRKTNKMKDDYIST